MTKTLLFQLLLFFGFTLTSVAQVNNFRFRQLLQSAPENKIPFAVENTTGLLKTLLEDKAILVKTATPQWLYIQASPQWISNAVNSGTIRSFSFDPSAPRALADTNRLYHHVDECHAGSDGLQLPFTGKDVIVGVVDQGLDYRHPDFIDENGNTRVLYYWDQTLPFNASRTPPEYGYGQVWTATDIQTSVCESNEESTAHGTSVTGAAVGNGRANGTNKGMAPEAKIIVIESNLSAPNWGLTVADACDFLFAKADELGLPAVMNLSVGDYLGSHDGTDPAATLMTQLVNEKPGRLIVCAAGNAGTWRDFHVGGNIDADTSFFWLAQNPGSQFGPNAAYFDLWSDVSAANWNFAMSAYKSSGTYERRSITNYRNALSLGAGPIYDTLWNGTNRIATVELYPQVVGSNFHMEVFFSHIDTSTYNVGFNMVGSGHFDAWSSANLALNSIVMATPSAAVLPSIVNYVHPDSLQTLVSSWACAPDIVTVGNIRNRFGHVDGNYNYYTPPPSYTSQKHEISINSSNGPNRANVIKPDVTAGGDVALGSGPFWLISNSAYNASMDSGHWHVRNGGTSMASPIVTGIAALYLEKCRKGTPQSFLQALHATSFSDGFTGAVPNNAYGYGKIHALNLLLQSNYDVTINADLLHCSDIDTAFAVSGTTIDSAVWSNGGNLTTYTLVNNGGQFYATTYDQYGCIALSDTVMIVQGIIPPDPVITGNGTILSTASYPNLQWYQDGTLMTGQINDTLIIPPNSTAHYTVVATSISGCSTESAPYPEILGLEELQDGQSCLLYPNPSSTVIAVKAEGNITHVEITDLAGKSVLTFNEKFGDMDISSLATGSYLVIVHLDNEIQTMKFSKI